MSSTAFIFLGLSVSVAGHTLLVQYSRQQPGPKYSTSTVVLMTEALKLMAGLAMVTHQQSASAGGSRNAAQMAKTIYADFRRNPRDIFKTCIPSFLYALQNNLVLVSLSNLDAPTFLMTSQLKIFFTAFFMWLLMGRTFSRQRCLSLAFLCAGEMLVHWENLSTSVSFIHCPDDMVIDAHNNINNNRAIESRVAEGSCSYDDVLLKSGSNSTIIPLSCSAANYDKSKSYTVGLFTALLTCLGSGFAGVYIEIVLKKSTCSFWIRNVQMYLWGIISNGIIVYLNQGNDGLFSGFNEVTVLIIVTSALVGFCIAFIIQKLDNIWKNLASSASVVMTTVASAILFGTPVGFMSTLGTIVLITVPWLYHKG